MRRRCPVTKPSESPEHYRKGRFFNPGAPPHRFGESLKWITHRRVGPWRDFTPSIPGERPPERVAGDDLRITFINHATVLLQTESYNLITDPIWSNRASPVQWIGPKRHRDPGIRFEDLPQVDCVLISHNHYDHLDRTTLRRLQARDNPAIFCPLGVRKQLEGLGYQEIYELDWWQEHPWRHLRLHCVPAQHFSARTPFDRNRTLWCGWVIEGPTGEIYFAGDTGFGTHFAAIARRFKDLRLALLPIGAYQPEWFMGPIHMNPEQAVKAHSILGASTAVGIHFGTFSLADDGETEATDRLSQVLRSVPEPKSFWILNHGEGREVPATMPERISAKRQDRP
jgi:L-ascorbate metabolism protein UlaG (beta-lactamase superfamily)